MNESKTLISPRKEFARIETALATIQIHGNRIAKDIAKPSDLAAYAVPFSN